MYSQPFYIEVPFPRKRRAQRSPSPADGSDSSRAPSPNPSPKKKFRGGKDVKDATSRLSKIALNNSTYRSGSPTVSDFAGPTIYSSGGDDAVDVRSVSVDDDLESITATGEVLFQFEKQKGYVDETSLPELLEETAGRGLPVRRLGDFTLFKCDGRQLINPAELLDVDLPDGMYGASGLVGSMTEDESDSEDSEDDDKPEPSCKRVELLTIVGFSVHDFREGEMNENIYIETEHAWYKLDNPSRMYRPSWTSFSMQHQFAHLVLVSALKESRTTEAQFIEYLNSEASEHLTESAFKSNDVVAYITYAVFEAIDSGVPINRVPLIRSFTDRHPQRPPLEPKKSKSTGPKLTPNKDSVPLVTPVIKRILEKHLISPVSVVGVEYEEANATLAHELHKVLEHHEDPQSMRWRKGTGQAGYSGVKMDGVIYEIGDVVAVAPGNDSNSDRANSEHTAANHCVNKFANNVWFIQIMYFFDDPNEKERGKPRKMLHGQWFLHGSRALNQETAHSQELFLLNECDDIAVATIFQKCNVRFLDVNESEEPDKDDPEARNYFCRYVYDDTAHSWLDLPSSEEQSRLNKLLPTHMQCPSCGRKDEEELYNTVRVVDDGLALHGRVYHDDDYVYVKPNSIKKAGLCLFIARVIQINCGTTDIFIAPGVTLKPRQLRVRHYERDSDDPRLVSRTRHTNCVNLEDLDGLCFIRPLASDEPAEIESWVNSHEDHFYVNAREAGDSFKFCKNCFECHCNELQQAQLFVLRYGKIPVLEVFSGAGGLSQGLDQTGFFKTKWAVEKSVPAARSFALNHPETKVLCTDINDLLRYSVDLRDEKTPATLRSSDQDRTPIPDDHVPKLGQPGLVCGGPPCQSFSGANGNKREDDPRSSLPFTMLSVAEVYEPNFFLLENVTGLLQHSSRAGDGRRVEKAMLKLIIRGLHSLDYQVRFKILQAGQYGAPQDRQRLIFFGAKRGCKLAEFPIPTHAFPRAADNYRLLLKNDHIPPAKRGRGPGDDHIFAPHTGVTIQDAIGDLPAFDWINPHKIKAKTPADVAERNQRIARGICQFDASSAPVGFTEAPYATPPTTRYQRAMRHTNESKVRNHVTDQASLAVIEASTTIPLEAGKNHKSLPKEFFEPSKLTFDSKPCYGRLDGNGYFKTALTTMKPRSRGSYILHPTQKRPLSVVEAKRAQGFPDDYVLWSDKESGTGQVKSFYQQIGNAVPVPLAAALGRSLVTAFIETWKRMPREGSPEL